MTGMSAALLLASRLLRILHADQVAPGTSLPVQPLANRLGMSRSPVNAALALLHARGLLTHTAGKGYRVGPAFAAVSATPASAIPEDQGHARPAHAYAQADHLTELLDQLGAPEPLTIDDICRHIADDRHRHRLPASFTEAALQTRYGLTRGQLADVLTRLENDGWADRNAGQGWTFSSVLTAPETLLQASRIRLLLEPAALVEPGYALDPDVAARCRAAEWQALDHTRDLSGEQLHQRGVSFHVAIASGSRNRFLVDALVRIHRTRSALPHGAVQDAGRVQEHAAAHLAVLDALERGRYTAAAKLLRRHLRSTHEHLVEALILQGL